MADYQLDHPRNVSKRNLAWMKNHPEQQDRRCSHGFDVGVPRATEEKETGIGCLCPLELLENENVET